MIKIPPLMIPTLCNSATTTLSLIFFDYKSLQNNKLTYQHPSPGKKASRSIQILLPPKKRQKHPKRPSHSLPFFYWNFHHTHIQNIAKPRREEVPFVVNKHFPTCCLKTREITFERLLSRYLFYIFRQRLLIPSA